MQIGMGDGWGMRLRPEKKNAFSTTPPTPSRHLIGKGMVKLEGTPEKTRDTENAAVLSALATTHFNLSRYGMTTRINQLFQNA